MRAVFLGLLLIACAEPAQVPTASSQDDRLGVWAPPPGSTILQTRDSKLQDPTLAVVSDLPSWQALWAGAWGTDPAPPLPTVDFVLESVLVVGLGKRAGTGYTVTIDSVVVHTSGSALFATEAQPGPACTNPPGSSAPVHMVHSPGHPPVTDWRVVIVRRDC